MGVCVNCGGALDDRWKFCIFCGTPVAMAPIDGAAPQPTPDPQPRADAEPSPRADAEPSPRADAEPSPRADAEPSPRADAEPSPTADAEPQLRADAEPSRPPIPAAIRTFVPVEIPNEDEDHPEARRMRRRSGARRVDVPLLLGVALGVAGVALIVYMVAVLSGQG